MSQSGSAQDPPSVLGGGGGGGGLGGVIRMSILFCAGAISCSCVVVLPQDYLLTRVCAAKQPFVCVRDVHLELVDLGDVDADAAV